MLAVWELRDLGMYRTEDRLPHLIAAVVPSIESFNGRQHLDMIPDDHEQWRSSWPWRENPYVGMIPDRA